MPAPTITRGHPATTWRQLRQMKRSICCESFPLSQHESWSDFQGSSRCQSCGPKLIRDTWRREQPGIVLAAPCRECGDEALESSVNMGPREDGGRGRGWGDIW